MNMTKFALGAMLLLLASVVRADPLLIGNFAGDEGLVDIEINGVLVAEDLDYLDVVTIDQSIGSLLVSARAASSGVELASLEVVFRAAINPMQPMLMLTPTGDQGSPELWLHQDSILDVDGLPPPITEQRILVSLINVSTIVSTNDFGNGFQLQYARQCRSDTGGGSAGASRYGFPQLTPIDGLTGSSSGTGEICDLQFSFVPAGSFEINDVEVRWGQTLRYLLVGNGASRPFQLIVVVGGDNVANSGGIAVEPGPLLPSNQYWFDRSRPAQGVALFEMPGARLLHGTWQTFRANGEAVWYLLDGTARELPGERDITIFAVDMEDGLRLTPAGTGRLTYFNCNEAEARFELDGEPARFIRLERSEPVEQCYALE